MTSTDTPSVQLSTICESAHAEHNNYYENEFQINLNLLKINRFNK